MPTARTASPSPRATRLATSAPATVSITINAVNDAPQLAGIETGALAYTENDAAKIVTETTTVSDVDSANFDTGTLTVDYTGGGTADDRLEIANQGNGPGQIGVSGTTVSFASTPIGTFAGGSGTTRARRHAQRERDRVRHPGAGPRRHVPQRLRRARHGAAHRALRADRRRRRHQQRRHARHHGRGRQRRRRSWRTSSPARSPTPRTAPPRAVTSALTVADLDTNITGATVTIGDGFAGAAQDVLELRHPERDHRQLQRRRPDADRHHLGGQLPDRAALGDLPQRERGPDHGHARGHLPGPGRAGTGEPQQHAVARHHRDGGQRRAGGGRRDVQRRQRRDRQHGAGGQRSRRRLRPR